jgi:hypothetical protein
MLLFKHTIETKSRSLSSNKRTGWATIHIYRTTVGDRVVQTFNQPDFARPDNRVSRPWYSQQAQSCNIILTRPNRSHTMSEVGQGRGRGRGHSKMELGEEDNDARQSVSEKPGRFSPIRIFTETAVLFRQ